VTKRAGCWWAVVLVACDNDGGAPPSLEACVPGWWMTDEARCANVHRCARETQACFGDDCTEVELLHLDTSGAVTSVKVAWSRLKRHVELLRAPTSGRWDVPARNRLRVVVNGRETSRAARCDGALLLHGDTGYLRLFERAQWDRAEQSGVWLW